MVKFKTLSAYFGRNGWAKCTGIDLYKSGKYINLQPHNTRGEGACLLSIHEDDLNQFIEQLKAFQNEINSSASAIPDGRE